ncbi:MAG: glycerol kinase GlpK [Microthrixaceae bacterium]
MSVVIAIDAGTTGVRAFAVDSSGRPVARSYREFPQHFPQPGWVEHDPGEILDATLLVLAETVELVDEPVAAIGITDQRETVVAWNRRTGEVLHRALVWQDRRTADRCDELDAQGALPRVRELTGLVLDPYFSASKMEWLLRDGGVTADADLALGTIDSWLVWNLTGGEFVTDPSNASRTLLYDIRRGEWSEELCDLFSVPASALAEVRPSVGEFGRTTTGLPVPAGVPISGIAGDQQASLFGQACLEPGMAKNTYGTGSFVLLNVGTACPEPTEGLLTTVAWEVPASVLGGAGSDTVTHYALEGAIFSTGSAVQWLRDGLEIIEDAAECGPLAESVDDTAGVFVVPAFTGLGSPYWDPRARASIVGITRGATRAHVARAVIESMALQTRDVVDAMTAASDQPLRSLRVDGGASAMRLLLQLQADQLGVTIERSAIQETTALGAAYLAGLGAGVWADANDMAATWTSDVTVEPGGDAEAIEATYRQWGEAVRRSRGWARD